MDDKHIVQLFLDRDENAIRLTQDRYGNYCFIIANNILNNHEDSEECLNDTWLTAWNTIPPTVPNYLGAYVGKITRFKALRKYDANHSKNRGGGEVSIAIEEISECLSSRPDIEDEIIAKDIVRCINEFLHNLPLRERNIFIQRYFYLYPVSEIAQHHGMKDNYIRAVLSRTRKKLKNYWRKREYGY